MATSVILPKQGQSVETCIITEWYKKKGERVEKGDLLFAYETDKSSFEEEAQAEGILLEIYFEEGDEVPVLSAVAVIGEEGETVEAEAKPPADEKSDPQNELEMEPAPAKEEKGEAEFFAEETGGDGIENHSVKLKISPRARKMAEAGGIDVRQLQGTGPNGRIIVRDIEALETRREEAAPASQAVSGTPVKEKPGAVKLAEEISEPEKEAAGVGAIPGMKGEWEDRPLSNMRKLIARAMHASLQNSAQLTHHLAADARSILSLRKKVKKLQEEGYEHNITLNDMICFAVVRALKKHPGANVHFMSESIRSFRDIHLGIAVDTDRGLMVPVLRDADDLWLGGLSDQIARLAESSRSGKIDPDLLQPEAATFTVSNLGAYGVEMFTPVINLPQAAILGVNTILERPTRMEDGTFGFIPYIGLSLTYDHRALDGGPATRFLAEIKQEIEQFDHDTIKL